MANCERSKDEWRLIHDETKRLPGLVLTPPRLGIPQGRESLSLLCFGKESRFCGARYLLRESRTPGLTAFSQVRLPQTFFNSRKNTEQGLQDLAH